MAGIASEPSTLFSSEVLAFASERGIKQYLHPVLEMTLRVFPTAERARAVLEVDPELPDERQIVFEVDADSSDLVAQHWEWSRELFRICPATHACLFGIHVNLSAA
jgi:hypothetical protein